MFGHLTIILLGNTGCGKSASGNTILGHKVFESKRSFKSVTTKICKATEAVLGNQVSVIDTPGILCAGAEEQIKPYCEELLQSSTPCVFLVVIKIDRFTEEQQRAVDAAIAVVGEQGLDKVYLLFTGGDNLDTTLEDFMYEDEECPLSQLVDRFKDKYLLFNNTNGGQEQVRKLLEKSALSWAPVTAVDRTIVLFGLSGAGKSSSGNTILGSETFNSDCGFEAATRQCFTATATVEGHQVTVIDTPGFIDTGPTPEELASCILNTIQDIPGIHAFVIVVQISRVTDAELFLLQHLPMLFGSNAAKYTTVLFTCGDKLRGQCIDDKISASRGMSELVSKCSGRYCVIDNTQPRNRQQVKMFLGKIDKIIAANGGQPCPVDLLNVAAENISSHPMWAHRVQHSSTLWQRFIAFLAWIIRKIRELISRMENPRYQLLAPTHAFH